MRRKIEITVLVSLAVLVAAGVIALAVREKHPPLGGGPVPPDAP